MKTRHLVLAGFLSMLAFMTWTLIKNKNIFSLSGEKPKDAGTRYVDVISSKADSTEVLIEGQGRISSSRRIDVSSEVQGLLLPGKILKPGTTVRQGELLFQVRDQDARLALQARKSNYMNILANALPDIRLDFSDVYQDWKTFFDQLDAEKPLPELPQPKTGREKSFLASKNIFGEYYTIRAEEERIRKYSIIAPFDGTITDVFAEPGSVVNPGTRLLSIIKGSDLEIELPIDVKNIGWVKMGAEVQLKATSGPGEFKGTVIRIGEFVNANTQSVPVYVRINKQNGDALYTGMYLTGYIHAGKIPGTISIPRRALFEDNHCFEVKDSVLLKRQLQIAFVTRESVIVSGIPNGTLLVAEPLTNVSDSMRVTPIVKQ